MHTPVPPSPFLVPFDGSFRIADAATALPEDHPANRKRGKQLDAAIEELDALQHRFHADGSRALLLVFQAMDAAGKDSTIRRVFSGVNPAGFRVHGFGAPSSLERSHDFLWRLQTRLPERGRIGIFNRSHYEEVLVVRLNPGFLAGQGLDPSGDLDALWAQRFESIRGWEKHLATHRTTVVKFFLHVSKEQQRLRFLDRLDDPEKNFKFNPEDLKVRARWDEYMGAYEDALNATSRPWAPWYCIPADDKKAMRVIVAQLLVQTLRSLDPQNPTLGPEDLAQLDTWKSQLEADNG